MQKSDFEKISENPILRIAVEKAGSAYREFKAAIDKHLLDGLPFNISDDRLTRIVVRELEGIDGIKRLFEQDPSLLETAFCDRYKRREIMQFGAKKQSDATPPTRLKSFAEQDREKQLQIRAESQMLTGIDGENLAIF